jgi:hypothetical protein
MPNFWQQKLCPQTTISIPNTPFHSLVLKNQVEVWVGRMNGSFKGREKEQWKKKESFWRKFCFVGKEWLRIILFAFLLFPVNITTISSHHILQLTTTYYSGRIDQLLLLPFNLFFGQLVDCEWSLGRKVKESRGESESSWMKWNCTAPTLSSFMIVV